jgi:hypothetical protein
VRLHPRRELVELASGVDAFYLSGVGSLPGPLVEDLLLAREEARETGTAVSLPLGGDDFRVSGGGLLRYPFRLDHPRGLVGVTTSATLPTVRVQPRAWFLHAVGVREGLRWFMELLESLLGPISWKASRVDLFMDSHGWGLKAEDRGRFVCRAGQRVTYEDDKSLSGLRFGSGKSASVMARIYDKTEECRNKGTDWWPAKWGELYQPGERVLRVEFQLGRELIRQTGLSTPAHVLEQLPSLWAYLTEEWLTFRIPTGDSTRSRWPLAPEWQDVQAARLRGGALGLERTYAGQASGSLRKLLPHLRGYLASAGALLGAENLEETMQSVARVLAHDEASSGVSFAGRLAEKRIALGLP